MKKTPEAGFTLVEILVAMAVMAMLLVLLLQIVDHTLGSTQVARRQIETSSEARRALDAMEFDLRRVVSHGGAAVLARPSTFPGMDALAFLTHGRGPSTSPADASPRFLAISYWWDETSGGTLWRGYSPVPATTSDLLQQTTAAWQSPTRPASPIARGLLRVVLLYELEDGTLALDPPSGAFVQGGDEFRGDNVPADWNLLIPPRDAMPDDSPRVVAIIAVAAALDEGTVTRLGPTGVTQARDDLVDPTTQEQMRDLVGYWESLAAGPTAQALRVFQKRIPLL